MASTSSGAAADARYNIKLAGARPAIQTRAATLTVVVDNDGAMPGQAAFSVRRASAAVASLGDAGDASGKVTLSIGDPGTQAGAFMSIETPDASSGTWSERLRIGPQGADVPLTLTACNLVASRNATVFGTLRAARYDNLISSHLVQSPFVPPSATALSLAYHTLSNMIASTVRYGVMDPNSGEIPLWPDATNTSDRSVDMGLLNCTQLVVLNGGSVDATNYLNLVQDYTNDASHIIPASAYALNSAYTSLRNELADLASMNEAALRADAAAPGVCYRWYAFADGRTLASISNDGVFTAHGGFSNLPVAGEAKQGIVRLSSSLRLEASNVAATAM